MRPSSGYPQVIHICTNRGRPLGLGRASHQYSPWPPRPQAFFSLTVTRPRSILPPRDLTREENLTTHLSSETETPPRLSPAHAVAGRPCGSAAPAPEGPARPDPLTHCLFRRAQRLTTPAHYRRVSVEGVAVRRPGLEIRVARSPLERGHPARLGITIRRVAVRTNVRRNQLKRWVREAFRRHPDAAAPGWDVVVMVSHAPPAWRAQDLDTMFVEGLAQARRLLAERR